MACIKIYVINNLIEKTMINFKDLTKKILKLAFVQWIACRVIALYIRFVFFTSKVNIHGYTEEYLNYLINGKATFVITWHGRILIAPMIVKTLYKKVSWKEQPCVLSSKHRDGQLASKTMAIFNFKEIFGSTINKDKLFQAEQSGAVKSIMIIMRELKNGRSIHLAPDGPRGPIAHMNSEIVNIAKRGSTPIFPVSINYSFKKQLNSWDKFQIPFPFCKIDVEYLKPIIPDKNTDFEETNLLLEKVMNDKMYGGNYG